MAERDVLDPSRWRPRRIVRFAVGFTWTQLLCLPFALAIFGALAITAVVPLPIPRYDALLIFGIVLTLVLWLVGWESGREVAIIAAFHVVGLCLELFKVHMGSWVYPEEAYTMIAGVPLYAGFMYAAVGSYIVQAWRRFDLRMTGFRLVPLTLLAVVAYANFFTHHWIPDLRWLIAIAFLVEMRSSLAHFTVWGHRYRMPLALALLAIGAFLWIAENAATFLGAWKYPNQLEVWSAVHVGKLGSWALLVSLSVVLVAALKTTEGTLYGHAGDDPSVRTLRRRGRGERPERPEPTEI